MAVFENENSSSSTFPNNAKNELEIWKPVVGEIMVFHGYSTTIAVIGTLDYIDNDEGFYANGFTYDRVTPLTFSLDYLEKGYITLDDL